jgi:DNA-binding response OmpR family regulator
MAFVAQFRTGGPTENGNRNDSNVRLTRKERALLTFLRQNAGRCLSREVLLQQVWGYRDGVKSRTLDVHVQRLRKKLGPDQGSKILTVFRGGYLWSNGNGTLGSVEVAAPSERSASA